MSEQPESEKKTPSRKTLDFKKALRVFGIVGIVVVLFAAIIYSLNSKPATSELVWDKQMTVGNLEAKNYFIIYSDIVCPYCVAFENAIFENEAEFEKYISDNDILVEVRLSDFLSRYGETRPTASHDSAIATYCAKNEGKFWDYYKKVVTTVWHSFFKDAGKSGFTELSKKSKNYWVKLGEGLGLSSEFESCVLEEKPASEVAANAEKSARFISGMPYFKFNSFTSSGFDLSWGWDKVLLYFEAGLEKKGS